jgi:hypothetical protein
MSRARGPPTGAAAARKVRPTTNANSRSTSFPSRVRRKISWRAAGKGGFDAPTANRCCCDLGFKRADGWGWQKKLNNRYSPAQIQKACNDVGGAYSSGLSGGGYSRLNPQNGCYVGCSKSGSCSGGCPVARQSAPSRTMCLQAARSHNQEIRKTTFAANASRTPPSRPPDPQHSRA